MIKVKFHTRKDRLITEAKMHHAPRVGEKIWLLPQEGRQSAYLVIDVCHWVSDVISEGYHECCVYVTPIK